MMSRVVMIYSFIPSRFSHFHVLMDQLHFVLEFVLEFVLVRPRSSSRSRTNEDEPTTNEDELGKKRFRAINIDAGATPSDEIDGTCYEQVMSSVWQT